MNCDMCVYFNEIGLPWSYPINTWYGHELNISINSGRLLWLSLSYISDLTFWLAPINPMMDSTLLYSMIETLFDFGLCSHLNYCYRTYYFTQIEILYMYCINLVQFRCVYMLCVRVVLLVCYSTVCFDDISKNNFAHNYVSNV